MSYAHMQTVVRTRVLMHQSASESESMPASRILLAAVAVGVGAGAGAAASLSLSLSLSSLSLQCVNAKHRLNEQRESPQCTGERGTSACPAATYEPVELSLTVQLAYVDIQANAQEHTPTAAQ